MRKEIFEFIGMAIGDFFGWMFEKDNTVMDKFSDSMDKLSYFFAGGKK